jgi:glycosyltransferase involved in cell wall biosynthesis
MKPLVSIIIPTHNRAKTLFRAIESCLIQTYSELEVLVIDDGSSDETAYVVKSFKDKRVRYFLNKDNSGLAAVRNIGLRKAAGEFVAFLDDDDEWLPEKISKQLKVFRDLEGNVGLICTNGYSEYEKNYFIKEDKPSGIIYDHRRDHFFPLTVLIPPPSSWMIPRAVIDEIGYFDEKMLNHWDDGDYLFKLASKYPVYFINENLVIWHALAKHVNMISKNLIISKELFLKKHYDLMKKDREYLFRFCRTLGKDAVFLNKPMARKYLLKALLMKPSDFSILKKLYKSFLVNPA